MNMISQLRQRVKQAGNAEITTEEFNQLQTEWVFRTLGSAQVAEMLRMEREKMAAFCDDKWTWCGDQIADAIRALPDEVKP